MLIQEQNRNYSKSQEELDGIAIQCNGLQDQNKEYAATIDKL